MNNLQKRWDRHHGYSTAYWVNIETPIIIFDSYINEIVSYVELSVTDQNIVDMLIDDFEDGYNNVIVLGCKSYEILNYDRFTILREIEKFGETVYQIHDFNEV